MGRGRVEGYTHLVMGRGRVEGYTHLVMGRGRVEGVGWPTQAICEVVLAAAVVDVVQSVRDRPWRHIIIFNMRRRGHFHVILKHSLVPIHTDIDANRTLH
jgi:hypothetical protein